MWQETYYCNVHPIWICYQQCDQYYWHIYISHHWHMPLTKYASHIIHVILHYYCGLHIDPILLDIQVPKKFSLLCYWHICANNKYAPFKCHICQLGHCMIQTTISIYMPHMNSVKSTMLLQAVAHIHSHYWHMPLNKYFSHTLHTCFISFLF